jgi:hypothetical protein
MVKADIREQGTCALITVFAIWSRGTEVLNHDSIVKQHIKTRLPYLHAQIHLRTHLSRRTTEPEVDTIRSDSAPAERHVNAFQEHDPFYMAPQRAMMIAILGPVPSQHSDFRHRRRSEQIGPVRLLKPIPPAYSSDGFVGEGRFNTLQPIRWRLGVVVGED